MYMRIMLFVYSVNRNPDGLPKKRGPKPKKRKPVNNYLPPLTHMKIILP